MCACHYLNLTQVRSARPHLAWLRKMLTHESFLVFAFAILHTDGTFKSFRNVTALLAQLA